MKDACAFPDGTQTESAGCRISPEGAKHDTPLPPRLPARAANTASTQTIHQFITAVRLARLAALTLDRPCSRVLARCRTSSAASCGYARDSGRLIGSVFSGGRLATRVDTVFPAAIPAVIGDRAAPTAPRTLSRAAFAFPPIVSDMHPHSGPIFR